MLRNASIATFVLAAVIGWLAITTTSYAQEQIRTLTAVATVYPPYEFPAGSSGGGISVDLVNTALLRMGEGNVHVSFFPWSRALDLLRRGQVDMAFSVGSSSRIGFTAILPDTVLVQKRYFLFTRPDRDLELDLSFDAAHNFTLAVRRGVAYGNGPFAKALERGAFHDVYKTNSVRAAIDLVIAGRADMMIGDYLAVKDQMQEMKLKEPLKLVGKAGAGRELVVLNEPTYVAFASGRVSADFVRRFDQSLRSLRVDGTYGAIFRRYFPRQLCPRPEGVAPVLMSPEDFAIERCPEG